MKILGIDPGSLNCGYGLIRAQETKSQARQGSGSRCLEGFAYLSSGRLVMPESKPLHERLKDLYVSLAEVITELHPDEIVIEKIFYAKGVKAALSLGHARGVVLLASTLSGLPIFEYSPLEVKQAVVGYGRADKTQVQSMVKEILKIRHALSADGADALAIALCHANTHGPLSYLSSQQKQKRVLTR
ncbi:MAG: crossover junction endodeoxyribonuclease RuvC [Dissulfurispiraceae bacterium]|jgi:crossover junction endodeoxyribonuclease RuvC